MLLVLGRSVFSESGELSRRRFEGLAGRKGEVLMGNGRLSEREDV